MNFKANYWSVIHYFNSPILFLETSIAINVNKLKNNKSHLIPSKSVIVAEKRIGSIVAIVVKNQKLPKTRPKSFSGVSSWRYVIDGIKTPTTENPTIINII